MTGTPEQGAVHYRLATGTHLLRWWAWGPPGGPPVVCVHGLTRSGRDFDALAAALAARGHRVLCPDLPGRGASDWLPDPALYAVPTYVTALRALLATLPAPVDWVGTSLGGIVGMALAAAAPDGIARLVLNDIGATVPEGALARIAEYLGAAPVRFPDREALEGYLRRVHAPFGSLTDAQWRHLATTSARPLPDGRVALHYDPAIAAAARPPAGPLDLTPLWDAVRAPVLLLRGATSDVLTAETARAMAARPGVRLVEIAGAGHAPALLDPAQIALVADFLMTAKLQHGHG